MVKLTVTNRGGKEVVKGGLDVSGDTVEDLKKAFFKARRVHPSRQRFTLQPAPGTRSGTALADGKKLSDYNLNDGTTIIFKDLGPQIGYSTVFFWEYFGPLAVYSLFYFLPQIFYPTFNVKEKDPVQTLALAYWSFHYTKRLLETFLVHNFSHGTMPIKNLFINCSYYWLFAAWVSYFVNHPLYTPPPPGLAAPLLGAAMLCQAGNFWCHLIQKNLRPPGSKDYVIPRGFLFNYITCANYTCEIAGWVLFSLATRTLTAAIFTACGAYQMAIWAKGKHRRLVKTFDGKDGRQKYPRRYIMLPPFF